MNYDPPERQVKCSINVYGITASEANPIREGAEYLRHCRRKPGNSGPRFDIGDLTGVRSLARLLRPLPAASYLLTLHEAPAASVSCGDHNDIHRLGQ